MFHGWIPREDAPRFGDVTTARRREGDYWGRFRAEGEARVWRFRSTVPLPVSRPGQGHHWRSQLARSVRSAATVALVLAVAACSAAEKGHGEAEGVRAVRWSAVELPTSLEPVTLTPIGRQLLVGGRGLAGEVRPRMLTVDGANVETQIPLQPVSPYAFEAKWLAIVASGDRLTAVGGAPGGAHSNTRWTAWEGSISSVRELPQTFETFGGWGAGSLVGLTETLDDGPVIVGSWESRGAGLDIAIWRPRGEKWVRQKHTPAALASSATGLLSARSSTPEGSGLLLAGSATLLRPGKVQQVPAIWRSPSVAGPWTRTTLPGAGSQGEAHGASCDQSRCFVVGHVDGEVGVWEVVQGQARRLDAPSWAVPERAQLVPPVMAGGDAVVAVPAHDGVRLLMVGSHGWSTTKGPDGTTVIAAALSNGSYYIVTATESGGSRLWSTSATALQDQRQ